jgi:hypothetical protein
MTCGGEFAARIAMWRSLTSVRSAELPGEFRWTRNRLAVISRMAAAADGVWALGGSD